VNLRYASSSRPSGIARKRSVHADGARVKSDAQQAWRSSSVTSRCCAPSQRDGRDLDEPDADVALRLDQRLLARCKRPPDIDLSTFFAPPGFIDTSGCGCRGRDLTADAWSSSMPSRIRHEKFAKVPSSPRMGDVLYPGQRESARRLFYGTGDDGGKCA
jgi:hypothetical protein